MNVEIVIVAAAIHVLFWDKLPEWGTLFNRIIAALPRCLQALYKDWHCPYCAGFWIALVLHGLTGMWFLPSLAELPSYLALFALPIGWFLDALAVALGVLVIILALRAIGLPAMKAHMMREEFMKSKKKS